MVGLLILLFLVVAPAVAGAYTPLPPTSFVRTAGAPDVFTHAFSACSVDRAFRLIVENGPDGSARVSSAAVMLNGVEAAREREFNQQTARVERSVRLEPLNRLVVRLAGKPGGTVAVRVEGTGGCVELALTDPPPDRPAHAGSLLVHGTVRGAPDVAVAINGVPAGVHGEAFAALVFVDPSIEDLHARATAGDGNTVEVSQRLVVLPATEPEVFLRATPASGAAPLAVHLTSLPSGQVVPVTAECGNGEPGLPDSTGDGWTCEYQAPGLYFPTISVADPAEPGRVARAVVEVVDRAAFDARLQAQWNGLKAALRRSDVTRAVEAIVASERDAYRELLTALTIPLDQIDRVLTDIKLEQLEDGRATYKMVRLDGDGTSVSHFVLFVRDADGIWRLKFF